MKLYKLILLIIIVGIAFYFIGGKLNKEIVYKQIEKEVILDNLTGKVFGTMNVEDIAKRMD